MSGAVSTLTISLFSLCTTGRCIFAGPNMPNHEGGCSKPGTISPAVGTFGATGKRREPSHASSLSFPEAMNGRTLGSALRVICIWPPTTSLTAMMVPL